MLAKKKWTVGSCAGFVDFSKKLNIMRRFLSRRKNDLGPDAHFRGRRADRRCSYDQVFYFFADGSVPETETLQKAAELALCFQLCRVRSL